MSKNILKRFLPKKLLPRLLLIFLLPLIITQCSVIFFFYDRHWEKIINRFSNIASNKINLIIDQYNKEDFTKVKVLAAKLNINLKLTEQINEEFKKKSFLEKKIYENILSRVNKKINVSFKENLVSFFYETNNKILIIEFPRKYLLSETPTIYILWIISTSLALSLIAFLFLRIQIRAIHRLSRSAEDFGQGKEIANFKPEGAMEIRSAGNSFIKMRRRINNYILQRTSFLAGISHDLGTIITRIKLRLELLDDQKEIKQIKKDVDIMQVFLKEYLDYSESINISTFSKINIFDIIQQVVESSKSKKKKINIICPKSLTVKSNKNSLYRIIFNLFDNASRYGNEIRISGKRKMNDIIIDIEDNGPGIKNEFRKNIFKPFFKIDDSRNLNKSGSGLGLSIAYELAKKIKAKINIKDSQDLKGSLFSIILPLKG
ncbi:MAG: ATP-binding protein [Pseudomonadota bacterium]|nr:ATP-binding protein [Pseudomonadota bacterium]